MKEKEVEMPGRTTGRVEYICLEKRIFMWNKLKTYTCMEGFHGTVGVDLFFIPSKGMSRIKG